MLQAKDKTYTVECIKGHRKKGDKIFYLIKWYGFPDSENTWEPEENLSCPKILKEYKTRISQGQKKRIIEKKSVQSKQIIEKHQTRKTVRNKHIAMHKHINSEKEKQVSEICGFAADSKKDQIIYIVKLEGDERLTRLPSSVLSKWAPTKLALFLEDHILF